MSEEFLLKHKNHIVASFQYESDVKTFSAVNAICEPERLPFLHTESNDKNLALMNKWLENRGIPNSREGINELLNEIGVLEMKELTILSMGLNLTDHYWICPARHDRKWEEVNFHDNTYSEYVGKLLFEFDRSGKISLGSPDLASSGHLRKRWRKIDGKNILLKDGSADIKQEPYNEVIASYIMDKLGMDHVDYFLIRDNKTGGYYCGCECMIDHDVEFIDAFKVYLHNTDKFEGKYNDFMKVCGRRGIADAKQGIDRMICIDYIIGNVDRNDGNFGVIRDAETLKWLKLAPIFDNGNSLWFNIQNIENINAETDTANRSFNRSNLKNMELIDLPCWYDGSKLNGLEFFATGIYSRNRNLKPERIEKIAGELARRIKLFERNWLDGKAGWKAKK